MTLHHLGVTRFVLLQTVAASVFGCVTGFVGKLHEFVHAVGRPVDAIGNRMINARAETLAEKSSFRDAFKRRRCLVLADGWYEWQVAPGGKQPWFIRMRDARPMAFAGLWERWKDPANGATLESCTIVTTDAAESIRRIHDRMPVVLAQSDWDRWMDTAFSDTDKLSELLRPFEPKALQSWPVSRQVNAPKNQGPELIERDPSVAVSGD
jgi:putative SOS response-associated peptidase YedK